MMRKLTLIFAVCAAFTASGLHAQQKSAGGSQEKAVLKVSKDDLKSKVRSRSNGDTMVAPMKLALKHYFNIPPFLDSYLAHYFPSINMEELDKRIDLWKTKSKEKNPTLADTFGGISSATARQGARIKQSSSGESNMRSRISSGIALYWVADVDYEFVAFLHDRNAERSKFKNLSEWKKELPARAYKTEPKGDKRKALYFLIVGFNTQSGEFAIATSPDMDTVFWVTGQEIKKYTMMLWEPTL